MFLPWTAPIASPLLIIVRIFDDCYNCVGFPDGGFSVVGFSDNGLSNDGGKEVGCSWMMYSLLLNLPPSSVVW